MQIHFMSALHVWRCRLKGVQIGTNCTLGGAPRIHKKRNSRIVVADGAMLLSDPQFNTLIHHPVSLNTIKEGAFIELGERCGLSGVTITCSTHISIGAHTAIGANTVIYDCKQHDYYPEVGWRGIRELGGAPIRIGERCFIGMNCIILKGVTIGDNCVVSAGTVISRDVPAGHLAQGNPVKLYPLSERLRTLPDGSVLPLGQPEV